MPIGTLMPLPNGYLHKVPSPCLPPFPLSPPFCTRNEKTKTNKNKDATESSSESSSSSEEGLNIHRLWKNEKMKIERLLQNSTNARTQFFQRKGQIKVINAKQMLAKLEKETRERQFGYDG